MGIKIVKNYGKWEKVHFDQGCHIVQGRPKRMCAPLPMAGYASGVNKYDMQKKERLVPKDFVQKCSSFYCKFQTVPTSNLTDHMRSIYVAPRDSMKICPHNCFMNLLITSALL